MWNAVVRALFVMRRWLFPVLAGGTVGGSILAAGGDQPAITLLAATGALTFGDLARRGVAERVEGRRDPTDLWMSVAFALVLIGAAWDVGRNPMTSWLPEPPRMTGLVLIAGGLWLRHWAARALGENFLVRLGLRQGHTLVRTGPFRWIRHPTYAALLSVAIGTAVAFGSMTALLVTIGVWLPLVFARMSREERILTEEFGDAYREYVSRTWRLVPGLV